MTIPKWHRIGPALLTLLAGCDSATTTPSAPPAKAEGEYKARIDRLDEGQRNAVFLRAVRDAGHDCQGVIGSAYSDEQFGMPAWVARCSDGRDWMVMLGKSGQALVARREEAPAK